MGFCQAIDAAPMLGVNMGTGTIQAAGDLVDYCNAPSGTYYADLRAKHGYPEPHNVKYWCVGNEMDGPWQMGHLDAARLRRQGARSRQADALDGPVDPDDPVRLLQRPDADLPGMGSRGAGRGVGAHGLPLHALLRRQPRQRHASFLASAVQFERFVDTLDGTLRYVKAKRRSKHDVYLSWDEWQVWYKGDPLQGNWTEAPHLAEEMYNLEDALVVGQWLNVFLRKSHVLKIACVAQIVNVISWLHTRGDDLLKQPSFYAFKLVSNHARGQALDVLVRAPRVETKKYGDVPVLDVSASYDPASGKEAIFIVNRSQTDSVVTDIAWQDGRTVTMGEAWQLAGTDPKALNTWEESQPPSRPSRSPPPVVATARPRSNCRRSRSPC